MYKQFTRCSTPWIILLFSMSSTVLSAQSAVAAAEPDQSTQTVTVSGQRDPDWKPYRKMLDGLDAFEKYHALAPQAELRFVLRPQKPNLPLGDLKLHIVGDHTNIEIPIASDFTFSVPRDESAAQDDADLRLSTKKGLYRWRPDIHTPGIPQGMRRLGDLRLECEVRSAVDNFDLNFLKAAYLASLGGPCHTSRGRIFSSTAAPIASVTLVAGARREKLPPERLDSNDRTRFAPPLHDDSWPDDTLVEFEWFVPTDVPVASTPSN